MHRFTESHWLRNGRHFTVSTLSIGLPTVQTSNPIENVWDLIKKKIHTSARLPATLAELDAAVRREWDSLSTAYFKQLYASMKRRLEVCLRANGYPMNIRPILFS